MYQGVPVLGNLPPVTVPGVVFVGLGVGVTTGVAVGVGVTTGVAVGVGVTTGVGVGVADGVTVGVAVGVGRTTAAALLTLMLATVVIPQVDEKETETG